MKNILSAVFLLGFVTLSGQTVATIDVGKVYQQIDGFGASSAWHGQLSVAEVNAAFDNQNGNQMGLSILRVRIDPNSSSWAVEKQNAVRAKTFGAAILASPWSPPASMKTNNNTTSGELKPESYSAYATHLKNFCATLGVVDVVSLQNEPNISVNYESCTWNSAQMIDFCRNNASSIGKPVMLPEAYNFSAAFSDPILNDSAANANFSYIGGHIYGSKAFAYTKAITKGKKIWMTEHYYNGDGMDTCLLMAREIAECMYFKMNAYVWWYLRQPGCNLMNAGGSLKKKGYTMAQFSKFIRPGYYMVDVPYSPKTGLMMVAFKGPEQDVVVVLNILSTEQSLKVVFKNDVVPGVSKYVTSASKNLSSDGDIVCTANSFTDIIEPLSITTFVTTKPPSGTLIQKSNTIRIFPNPVSDILQISSAEKISNMEVFNMLGQAVIRIQNPRGASLDVSALPAGFYLLKIRQNDEENCFRFLKK
jgi:glucuronoarabinoxylan endo-1,4-beta-xylanase